MRNFLENRRLFHLFIKDLSKVSSKDYENSPRLGTVRIGGTKIPLAWDNYSGRKLVNT
jgi:hypothetical protein